jgi:hypothetical protein
MNTNVDAGRDSKGTRPLFCLGQIVTTPGALAVVEESDQTIAEFIGRHLLGDWGEELCDEDRQANEDALKEGLRLSRFTAPITEKSCG